MTEVEWLTCNEPERKLSTVYDKASSRKLRLFGVACVRRIWHLLSDDRSRQAVVVAEQFANGIAGEDELSAAATLATAVAENYYPQNWGEAAIAAADAAAATVMDGCYGIFAYAFPITVCAANAVDDAPGGADAERAAQAGILNDVFGPLPFRSVIADPVWLTPKVVELARTIFDQQAFDRMSELADVLHESGCANTDILTHCRRGATHVRGCWVVDLILGQE